MDELNPITRQEKIIAGENIQPITRMEKLLAGEDLEPVTRLEHFVKKYKDGSGSGGGTGGGGVEHSDYINPEWTDWGYLSTNDNRNDLVSKLKYNDTSNGISFSSMFRYCTLITEIPDFDTSNGTSFTEMFYYCSSLITAPNIDTSKGTNFNSMFFSCIELITIPRINLSLATNISRIFYNSRKLENITFEGIIPITQNIDLLSSNVSLTTNSLMSFINALQNTTGTTYKVTIGSTNLAKLTADQIQIATDKNITLA